MRVGEVSQTPTLSTTLRTADGLSMFLGHSECLQILLAHLDMSWQPNSFPTLPALSINRGKSMSIPLVILSNLKLGHLTCLRVLIEYGMPDVLQFDNRGDFNVVAHLATRLDYSLREASDLTQSWRRQTLHSSRNQPNQLRGYIELIFLKLWIAAFIEKLIEIGVFSNEVFDAIDQALDSALRFILSFGSRASLALTN